MAARLVVAEGKAPQRRAAKKPVGRPAGSGLKLTPDVEGEICKALEISVPLKYAAEAAGVPESTVYLWLERGKKGNEPYARFAGAVTRARAKAVKNLTTVALQGGKGSSAATWFLERRYRTDYGPIQKLEHSGPDGSPMKIEGGIAMELDKLTVDELRRLAAEKP